MSKIEGPQVMAAILALFLIAIVIAFVAPNAIDKIVGSVVTGIGMLGMKLLEDKSGKNGGA